MDSKLNSDEISALQSLDPGTSSGATLREGDLPQRLFAFNLITRQPSGTTVLTKSGERALFREACVSALVAIEREESIELSSGVEKWLRSAGFVDLGSGTVAPAVTQRGKLWMASFQADAGLAGPELRASDFARRRA
ncbi:MAG: hypothetical protein ABWY27_03265 [Telluria sp.]